jgi:hypothetical protein
MCLKGTRQWDKANQLKAYLKAATSSRRMAGNTSSHTLISCSSFQSVQMGYIEICKALVGDLILAYAAMNYEFLVVVSLNYYFILKVI